MSQAQDPALEVGLGTGLGLVGVGLPFGLQQFLPFVKPVGNPEEILQKDVNLDMEFGKSGNANRVDSKMYADGDSEPENEGGENSQARFVCHLEDCQKVFQDIATLRKHQLTHGEKMFTCPVASCRKKFLDNSKLKRHQLVHTGEKPYKCDICKKCFSLDFNLRTHLRTHTGEKPYICSFTGCNKRFTQSSNLTAHEKTHFNKDGQPVMPGNSEGEEINEEDYDPEEGTIPEAPRKLKPPRQKQEQKPRPIFLVEKVMSNRIFL